MRSMDLMRPGPFGHIVLMDGPHEEAAWHKNAKT
jgi:hypothetical protein